MMNLRSIGVEDGEKDCSCGYSSQRYWTNYSSSNIFPAGTAWVEDPAGELARRGGWDHARGKRPAGTEIDLHNI